MFSGPVVVDEAISAARAVCASNSNAALLVLCPMTHTSLQQTTCVKNRRAVEDRLLTILELALLMLSHCRCLIHCCIPGESHDMDHLRAFDVIDVAINYKDTGHAGDKRKRSQPGSLALIYASLGELTLAFLR